MKQKKLAGSRVVTKQAQRAYLPERIGEQHAAKLSDKFAPHNEMPRFAHSYIWIKAKGKMKILCKPCGVNSGWIEEDAVEQWKLDHASIRETKRRESGDSN